MKAYYNPTNFPFTPMSLGDFSVPLAYLSSSWLLLVAICYCLPTSYPINPENMNYAVVVIFVYVVFIIMSWYLYSKNTFCGPRRYSEI